MVVTLKGSIDNTNDLKWTINHIFPPHNISPERMMTMTMTITMTMTKENLRKSAQEIF